MVSLKYEEFHSRTHIQERIIRADNFTYRTLIPYIDKYLVRNKRVLDIGSGAGTLCFYFAKRSKNITGIDISKNAVEASTQTAKNLNLKNVKFKQMNFPQEVPSGKFDFIIFTEVIEHLEDDERALMEIYQLLDTDGLLYLSTPSVNAPLHKIGYSKAFDQRVGHVRRYEPDKLTEMIEDAGFKILEVRRQEGIVRNFLFLNSVAGKFIRYIKYYISDLVTAVDNLSIGMLGESNIVVIAKKI